MNMQNMVRFNLNLRKNILPLQFPVYKREPERYNIDAGDVSYMKGIKKKLKCRHFSYFLNVVVPDMLERYPFEEPPGFAFGAVRSLIFDLNIDKLPITCENIIRSKVKQIPTDALTLLALKENSQSGFIHARNHLKIQDGIKLSSKLFT